MTPPGPQTTPKQSKTTQNPRTVQNSPDQCRAAQSSPEQPRAAQSSLEQPRATQSRRAQRSPEQRGVVQRSPEQPRVIQSSPEDARAAHISPEQPRAAQSSPPSWASLGSPTHPIACAHCAMGTHTHKPNGQAPNRMCFLKQIHDLLTKSCVLLNKLIIFYVRTYC